MESHSELPTGRNAAKNFTIGALGGLAAVLVNLLFSTPSVIETQWNIYYTIGFCVKLIILTLSGGIWAFQFNWQYSRNFPAIISFQLGMIPALYVIMVLSIGFGNLLPIHRAAYNVPEAPNVLVYAAAAANSVPLRIADQTEMQKTSPSQGVFSGFASTAISTAGGREVLGFWIIFGAVTMLTAFSGCINVYLVSRAADTQRVTDLIENFSTTWKLGFGAIIGLIGGKAL